MTEEKRWQDAVLETDVLVIGSEGAGARAALRAAETGLRVLVVTKGFVGRSGATLTADADVDIDSRSAADLLGLPGDRRDSPEKFAEDMIRESEYISDQELVRIHCEEAPLRIRELVDWGARTDGLTQAPGHRYPRGVWIPGTEFPKVFAARFRDTPNVRILDGFQATDLLTGDGRVTGVCGIHMAEGDFQVIRAGATILCTGGAMRLYPRTTAPEELTGDGMAMAWRAGAQLIDMEFPMFLPYTMIRPESLSGVDFPYSLSAYMEAWALNRTGERYMARWDPERMERSTRDVNSIAAMMEVLEGRGTPGGGTYLSVAHIPENMLEESARWFPENMANWRYGGFRMKDFLPDLTRNAVETSPAAHFWNGGIRISSRCETTVPGLYAAGEGTGSIMGANRISGNALTMTQVWGYRAGQYAAEFAGENGPAALDPAQVEALRERVFRPLKRQEGVPVVPQRKRMQTLAWEKVGVVREEAGLREALENIREMWDSVLPELWVSRKDPCMNREWLEAISLENSLQILEIVAAASLARPESRGALYRRDYPLTDNRDWLKNLIVSRRDGQMVLTTRDVDLSVLSPRREVRKYGQKE